MSIPPQPGSVPLALLEILCRTGVPARLDPACDTAIEKGASRIAGVAAGSKLDMTIVEVARGNSPVIRGFRHTGTDVPPAIRERRKDCYSIRSLILVLFGSRPAGFNVGVDDGRTCAPQTGAAFECVQAAADYTSILNGIPADLSVRNRGEGVPVGSQFRAIS